MGTSTDATLFYGLCYWEEGQLPWEDPEGDYDARMTERHEVDASLFADILCKRLGGPKYPVCVPEFDNYTGMLRAYWEERDAFILATLGEEVVLVTHCHHEIKMYGIALKRTVTVASRGGPEKIEHLGRLEYPELAREALRKFCVAFGMDFYAEECADRLGWWLVSYWA